MKQDYFKNILGILRLVGGKFVIVEDGEPRAVLMSYKEFEDLVAPLATDKLIRKMGEIEAVNKKINTAQIQDLRSEVISEDVIDQEFEQDGDIHLKPLD